jgi:hypothetical protein
VTDVVIDDVVVGERYGLAEINASPDRTGTIAAEIAAVKAA